MNLKTAIGFILIFVGLVVAIAGYSGHSAETVNKKIEGQEVVLLNTASNHANWQSYIGFLFAGIGVVFIAFPDQETIRRTQ